VIHWGWLILAFVAGAWVGAGLAFAAFCACHAAGKADEVWTLQAYNWDEPIEEAN